MWKLLLLLSTGLVRAEAPPVKVSLRSSWPAPPPLVEVLETVANENPHAFFPFVDSVTNPETLISPDKLKPEAIHHYALRMASNYGFVSGPGALSLVEMNLALHTATPKIEAFYHHYLYHANRNQTIDCGSWVDWYGTAICDVETLVQLVGTETIDSANKTGVETLQRPKRLPFDHIFPYSDRRLAPPPRTAILYASLTSPNFRELHTYLWDLARRPDTHVEYVFRHVPPKNVDPSSRNSLSGYSVALDLKKMDYLALDDRNTKQKEVPDAEEQANNVSPKKKDPIFSLIEAYPENVTAPNADVPLTEEELEGIGLQAAQLIADSRGDPLQTLKTLSQDFPKYATSLARRVVVNESITQELHTNQLRVQGGLNAFWLNGASLAEKDINPLGLLRLLKREKGIIKTLTSLGLWRTEAIDLLNHPAITAAQSDKGVLDGIFDASDRIEGGGVIIWWNNIEKDSRYARWGTSLQALLRPMFPGQFHSIKLNLFNVVLVLDLSQMNSINFIAGAVSNIIERGFPFRFGVVPSTETPDGLLMARLFYHLVEQHGRKKTMEYVKKISQVHLPPQLQTQTVVDWSVVGAEYINTFSSEEEGKELAKIDDILSDQNLVPSSFDSAKVSAYIDRLGAVSGPGHAFVNGKHFDLDDLFLRNMQVEASSQLQHLQEELYTGKLTDESAVPGSIENYFYDLPSSYPRRNRYIIPASTPGSLKLFNIPEIFAKTGYWRSPATFIYPTVEPNPTPIPFTVYIIADLDSVGGKQLVAEALKSITEDSKTRFSFIHNPVNDPSPQLKTGLTTASLLSHLVVTGRLAEVSSVRLLRALDLDSSTPDYSLQALLSKDALDDVLDKKIEDIDFGSYQRGKLVLRELGIAPGEQVVVINGRVVGPMKGGDFVSADFEALESYELRKRVQPVMDALDSLNRTVATSDRSSYAHLASMASSVVAAIQMPDPSESGLFDAPPRPRQRGYKLLESEYTSFESGDNKTALFQIAVLVDPLSETAQKWASLLEWLSHIPDAFVVVHLNPARYKELPIKRFFRSNLRKKLSFDESGVEIPAVTVFEGLPIDPIYTLAVDVPPSWLVRPRESLYDLDNIQLAALNEEDKSLDAVFELDYLVIEGHARDPQTNAPPRGLQLALLNGDGTPIDDTQVVANLGYFQFKAKPGVFELEIREGRGRDIFELQSVGNEGWDSPTVAEVGREITLTSFEGLTLYPRFERRPGKEEEDVLRSPNAEEDTGGILDFTLRFKSLFGAKESAEQTALAVTRPQADINIFTVASGLLYERFVAIMVLSVLRNTKSTVKFWFIENFLSPSFLEFIPHFAQAYNFQYELVTYKWPSWLRAQKEKQRIIWAYKILFLDVLFPMDLKKVIFVDADQIVRADLQELVDLDLHGAPYGYTPMGDDNYDMEGFRFWKTGYWKDFLQGRPYHISALYVVDLVKFRQLAAGDILRGHYQQLSADPNSLANLDQDLPNNLQREVPIFSLHEDWLWCETWCSKDRLDRAKTIDLCQNPLTKEPKLNRARSIPEWEEYDNEISRFSHELAKKGLIRSRIATADQLANAGVAPVKKAVTAKEEAETSAEETSTESTVEIPQPIPTRDEL